MGYAICFAPCIVCGTVFGFNPNLVPSLRVNEKKEPLCDRCVENINSARIRAGLEPNKPLPGAYEPMDVKEIDW